MGISGRVFFCLVCRLLKKKMNVSTEKWSRVFDCCDNHLPYACGTFALINTCILRHINACTVKPCICNVCREHCRAASGYAVSITYCMGFSRAIRSYTYVWHERITNLLHEGWTYLPPSGSTTFGWTAGPNWYMALPICDHGAISYITGARDVRHLLHRINAMHPKCAIYFISRGHYCHGKRKD